MTDVETRRRIAVERQIVLDSSLEG